METLVFILSACLFCSSVALLIAIRIIKTQEENLVVEIRHNERLRLMYERLVRGEKDGK